jgi:hypothetical protein
MLSVCACCPVFGTTLEMAGGAMVKPFTSDATSPIVVIVTVCGPEFAVGLTVICADADVALFTVRLFTVTPAPKLAVVVPCNQWVAAPVIAMLRDAPCAALLGITD